MKIIQLVDSRSFGGIESHIGHLCNELSARNIAVQLVLLNDYGNHPLEDICETGQIPIFKLDGKFTSLFKLMIREKPAVIHTHGYKANIFGRLVGLLNSAKVVSTFHNGDKGVGVTRIYTLIDSISALLSRNIAVSRKIQSRLNPIKSHWVPNFIPLQKQPVDTNEALSKEISSITRIAFVGRLEEVKNPQLFAEIAYALPEKEFHLYGDGSLRKCLTEKCIPNLFIHGQVNNMDSVWGSIDLLLITSKAEGLPLVALEAMARGIIVIATPVGDLPHFIKSGENGFLAKENADDFVHAITMLETSTHQSKFGLKREARKTIEESYRADMVIPKLLEVYQG